MKNKTRSRIIISVAVVSLAVVAAVLISHYYIYIWFFFGYHAEKYSHKLTVKEYAEVKDELEDCAEYFKNLAKEQFPDKLKDGVVLAMSKTTVGNAFFRAKPGESNGTAEIKKEIPQDIQRKLDLIYERVNDQCSSASDYMISGEYLDRVMIDDNECDFIIYTDGTGKNYLCVTSDKSKPDYIKTYFDEYKIKSRRVAKGCYNITVGEMKESPAESDSEIYTANAENLNKVADYFYELAGGFTDVQGDSYCSIELTPASETSDALYLVDENCTKNKEVFLPDDIKNRISNLALGGIKIDKVIVGDNEVWLTSHYTANGVQVFRERECLLKSYDGMKPNLPERENTDNSVEYECSRLDDQWFNTSSSIVS